MRPVERIAKLLDVPYEVGVEIRVGGLRVYADIAVPQGRRPLVIVRCAAAPEVPPSFRIVMRGRLDLAMALAQMDDEFELIKRSGIPVACVGMIEDGSPEDALAEAAAYADEIVTSPEECAHVVSTIARNPWYPVFSVRRAPGSAELLGLEPLGASLREGKLVRCHEARCFIGLDPASDEVVVQNPYAVLRMVAEGAPAVRNPMKLAELREMLLAADAKVEELRGLTISDVVRKVTSGELRDEELPPELRRLRRGLERLGLLG